MSEKEYIITGDMLRYWKNRCIAEPAHTNTDQCKKCEYRGKGRRSGCCDFDDSDMEKIFRYREAQSLKCALEIAHCQTADCVRCKEWLSKHDAEIRNALLDELLNWILVNEQFSGMDIDNNEIYMIHSKHIGSKIESLRIKGDQP